MYIYIKYTGLMIYIVCIYIYIVANWINYINVFIAAN